MRVSSINIRRHILVRWLNQDVADDEIVYNAMGTC
jgi:hypothetical protein